MAKAIADLRSPCRGSPFVNEGLEMKQVLRWARFNEEEHAFAKPKMKIGSASLLYHEYSTRRRDQDEARKEDS